MSELKIDGEIPASDWLNNPEYRGSHQLSLDRYFGGSNSSEVFQGRNFEWFISQSSIEKFNPYDFLAINSLSVEIPAESQRLLLEGASAKFEDLLNKCQIYVESNKELQDKSWIWNSGNPLEELYAELRNIRGIGPVVCSKLMAAKFPAIIPIRDSKVEALLGCTESVSWWRPMIELYTSVEAVLNGLSSGNVKATNLRKLDVILWMEARKRGM